MLRIGDGQHRIHCKFSELQLVPNLVKGADNLTGKTLPGHPGCCGNRSEGENKTTGYSLCEQMLRALPARLTTKIHRRGASQLRAFFGAQRHRTFRPGSRANPVVMGNSCHGLTPYAACYTAACPGI